MKAYRVAARGGVTKIPRGRFMGRHLQQNVSGMGGERTLNTVFLATDIRPTG